MEERTLSPKFSRPTASPPRTTVKCNHDRNVLCRSNEIEPRWNERSGVPLVCEENLPGKARSASYHIHRVFRYLNIDRVVQMVEVEIGQLVHSILIRVPH